MNQAERDVKSFLGDEINDPGSILNISWRVNEHKGRRMPSQPFAHIPLGLNNHGEWRAERRCLPGLGTSGGMC
jgi:hypothetical protein